MVANGTSFAVFCSLQHLRSATVEAGGTIQRVVSVDSSASSPDSTDGVDPLQSKRQKIAESQRRNLMKQMSEMQKKFAMKHQNELDLLATEPAPTSPWVNSTMMIMMMHLWIDQIWGARAHKRHLFSCFALLLHLHTAMQQDAWLDSIPEYSMHDFRSQHNVRKKMAPQVLMPRGNIS